MNAWMRTVSCVCSTVIAAGFGTVGTGCLLELNGTHKLENPNYEPVWLKDGDVVEMEIEELGKIKNKIVLENDSHSLFGLKKNM